jgi:hypothetical protein
MAVEKLSSTKKAEGDNEVMKKKFRRKLKRQLKKIRDPRRYLVASYIKGFFKTYYIVESNTFILKNIQAATPFKSKRIAHAVKKALGKHYKVITVWKTKSGRLSFKKPKRKIFQ